jgi:hypothetical protein
MYKIVFSLIFRVEMKMYEQLIVLLSREIISEAPTR